MVVAILVFLVWIALRGELALYAGFATTAIVPSVTVSPGSDGLPSTSPATPSAPAGPITSSPDKPGGTWDERWGYFLKRFGLD